MAKRSRAESASPTPEANDNAPSPSAAVKYVHVDDSVDAPAVITCSLPAHPPLIFATYSDYDVHYQKYHVNRCSACRVNFPSEQFLNLHFDEYHDPIKQASRERGDKIFACFSEGCDVMCKTPKMRREHMVAKHAYPKNYNFTVLKYGIDGLNSMLIENNPSRSSRPHRAKEQKPPKRHAEVAPVPKRIVFDEDGMAPQDSTMTSKDDPEPMDVGADNSEAILDVPNNNANDLKMATSQHLPESNAMDVVESEERGGASSAASAANTSKSTPNSSNPDETMEDVTKSVAALRFIPPSIRFGRTGRGRGRGGFAKS
ncbi:hypothetical protein IWX90DRAFT_41080 [Phyllosticta citrichinensis]|uniref:C2H2-type domain-containing protein n=1 Tax=Phyllosticta citrichinensis TaxID=1130410 RepID=A0ABR1Y833_9PEZI